MNVAHHEFSSSSSSSRSKEKPLLPLYTLFPPPQPRNRFAAKLLLFCILPICLSTSDRLSTPTSPNELFCLTVHPPPRSSVSPLSRYIGHKVKMLINAVEAQISSGFLSSFAWHHRTHPQVRGRFSSFSSFRLLSSLSFCFASMVKFISAAADSNQV